MVDPVRPNGERYPAAPSTHRVFVGKAAALARAIAATPANDDGLRVWQYADATFVADRWVCVLEDDSAVYAVSVHPHTGASPVVVREGNETPGPGRFRRWA